MTTFGHSLTGLALLIPIIPPQLTFGSRLAWAIVFIALANVPDWPLPVWGHSKLAVSHSLWMNTALCLALTFVLRRSFSKRHLKIRVLVAGAAAWLSHLGMDALYGNLSGVAIYWPFSDARLSLPVPWLNAMPHVPPPFDQAVMRIFIYEFLTFAPFILLACGLRYFLQTQEGN